MTELLEKAIIKLKELPEPEQDSMATLILTELAPTEYVSVFAGMTASEILAEAIGEYEAGLTKPMTKNCVIPND